MGYESLSLTYLFDDIEITDIRQSEYVPSYPHVAQCADYIVFQVDFTKSYSAKDNLGGFILIGVCKETDDSPWRIDSMFTGW